MSFCSSSHFTASPISFSLFFFFYCSGHHRALHSFPTRRSSDLPAIARFDASSGGELSVAGPLVPDRLGLGLAGGREDRKSTRLNSSHRTISYAVFCLKKKKKNKIQTGCNSYERPQWSKARQELH